MLKMESMALRILELEDTLKDYKQSMENIHGLLFSIGGPLNDNIYCYNKKQLNLLFRINDELIK